MKLSNTSPSVSTIKKQHFFIYLYFLFYNQFKPLNKPTRSQHPQKQINPLNTPKSPKTRQNKPKTKHNNFLLLFYYIIKYILLLYLFFLFLFFCCLRLRLHLQKLKTFIKNFCFLVVFIPGNTKKIFCFLFCCLFV